ncbi:MAG: RNA-binding S4 domain-containing protein [Clostridiales bacterium]|nr:RNA-binding S4 domain-containing protein [Clostridiales bacterium]
MRLDKYLKISRIIKRRTVAKEACDTGRVSINGRTAKPGSEVKAGDVIEIRFGSRFLKAQILGTPDVVRKGESSGIYKIIEGEDNF